MPKKAAAKSAAKCCDKSMKNADAKSSKLPFTPFKKGEKPDFKKGKK